MVPRCAESRSCSAERWYRPCGSRLWPGSFSPSRERQHSICTASHSFPFQSPSVDMQNCFLDACICLIPVRFESLTILHLHLKNPFHVGQCRYCPFPSRELGRAGTGDVCGKGAIAPASPSSWDLPGALPGSVGGTIKAPVINVCSPLPPQIPEGASLAMSLSDKKDTTLSRGNVSPLFPCCW